MEFSFGLMGFLIVFPLIVAAALLFVRQEGRAASSSACRRCHRAGVGRSRGREPGGELHALRV